MAKCKWCNKKGFFVSVNGYGLCKQCSIIILTHKQQSDRIISESLEIIEKTKKLDTGVSRYDLIIQKLEDFLPYYRKGINFYGQDLIDSIQEVRKGKNESILDILTKEKERIIKKVLSLKTEKSKRSNIEKYNNFLIENLKVLEVAVDNYEEIKSKIKDLHIK